MVIDNVNKIGREIEFCDLIKYFKQNNALGESLYVDSSGFICGKINEVWALACYCESVSSGYNVDKEQIEFAKKCSGSIESMLFNI